MRDEKYIVNFYDKDDNEIGRKTYKTYGGMITYGYKRAKKIGAKFFWHVQYLRRFELYEEED